MSSVRAFSQEPRKLIAVLKARDLAVTTVAANYICTAQAVGLGWRNVNGRQTGIDIEDRFRDFVEQQSK